MERQHLRAWRGALAEPGLTVRQHFDDLGKTLLNARLQLVLYAVQSSDRHVRVDDHLELNERSAPEMTGANIVDGVDFARRFRDVMATVDYDASRITPELLAQGFGSAEAADAAETAADEAATAIDEWSISGCGDFCDRWPELFRALDRTGDELWWVRDQGEEGPAALEGMLRSLEDGGRLVPDELRADWELAVAARRVACLPPNCEILSWIKRDRP